MKAHRDENEIRMMKVNAKVTIFKYPWVMLTYGTWVADLTDS